MNDSNVQPQIRFFVATILAALPQLIVVAADRPVDFNRDIRPILSDACFHCHGPDPGTREADLRLDQESFAKQSAIVAGNSSESELIRRVLSDDGDEVMPPHDSGKELSPEQKKLLKTWVDEGAVWADHWAFVPPTRHPQPQVNGVAINNPIDAFVAAQLQQEQLAFSESADNRTLARRVALDLTGLPPNREQLSRFVTSSDPHAFSRYVDDLMSSEHFGERMAMSWLDAARYADSDGYQQDATRQNWPWRDWVVNAFNTDMPFDQFTIEQFAGDLMTDATSEQILATCFHRNHMHNGEGGRDPEESRVEYVIDRVNTVGTVWMGLTLGCAQCHTHKYDPISHAEYYQLSAFFNSIEEDGKAGSNAKPFLRYQSPYVERGLEASRRWLKDQEDRLAELKVRELRGFDSWLATQYRERIANRAESFASWEPTAPQQFHSNSQTELHFSEGIFQVSGKDPRHDDYLLTLVPATRRVTGLRLTVMPTHGSVKTLSRSADGHFILTNIKIRLRSADGVTETDLEIQKAVASYEPSQNAAGYGPVAKLLDDDPRTGWTSAGSDVGEQKVAAFALAEPLDLQPGEALVVELRQRSLAGYANLHRFSIETTGENGPPALSLEQTPLEELASGFGHLSTVRLSAEALPSKLKSRLEDQYLAGLTVIRNAKDDVSRARKRNAQYNAATQPQNVTVLKQREKPRDTHILTRGIWNAKGEVVHPATPAAVNQGDDVPQDRLELAKWLVDRRNPLTARVVVNRYWQMLFGHGLVRTPGDFGTQGEPPTHPQLLDWLAVEFMESGWNVKHILKLIVASRTYQQSSVVSRDLLERDPSNRLLARATRFRLPSWMIRDSSLAVSGLLDRCMGGPPVFPYQPVGAWLDATMGRFRYEPSVGSDRFRRSLYTFWRRSVGPTGMFDASKRRNCEVRSVRTNTPLHALTLMNDRTFVDASRELAFKAMAHSTKQSERVEHLFRLVLLRSPTDSERDVLRAQLSNHLVEYKAQPNAAQSLIDVDLSRWTKSELAECASLSMLASTLLNLDETVTRE